MIRGLPRADTSVPTLDTERQVPFRRAASWSPASLEVLGHSLAVDIPTGNLLVTTQDTAHPYYRMSLGLTRRYDAQEQWMALTAARLCPNLDPRLHWFGNWAFAYEADVEDVWHGSTPWISVFSGVGASGLFGDQFPSFQAHVANPAMAERTLLTYGIAGISLATLGWTGTTGDCLLRTRRGVFQILSGAFRAESVVDPRHADLWLFTPVNGAGYRVSSRFGYDERAQGRRETDRRVLVTDLTDCLGHGVTLRPESGAAPYTAWRLQDGAGRSLSLSLDASLDYPDLLNPAGTVRQRAVRRVTDNTKQAHGVFAYDYTAELRLAQVDLPSSIGVRRIRYGYDDARWPGMLAWIEDSRGVRISFEYAEDPTDRDERLNPRLKVHRILASDGVVIQYDYNHSALFVDVTVSGASGMDRQIRYGYVRDESDTRERYITTTETFVTRGYVVAGGNLVARTANASDRIARRTVYTTDGRFNIALQVDPLSRTTRYRYDDFNQVIEKTDSDGHWCRHTYDTPAAPNPANPIRYDPILRERQSLIRTLANDGSGTITEQVAVARLQYRYDRFQAGNSPDPRDRGTQSTHRLAGATDERDQVWTYLYDDAANFRPLEPTSIITPLNLRTDQAYSDRGERLTMRDAEGNVHQYRFTPQGRLSDYIDPNQGCRQFGYYVCGDWLSRVTDQLGKVTNFRRDPDGRLTTVLDPVGDTVDWMYDGNDRVSRVIRHRPALPASPDGPPLIQPQANVLVDMAYTPLGVLAGLRNANGLVLQLDYDEADRLTSWRHQVSAAGAMLYAYDVAGQLTAHADRAGHVTTFTYHPNGFLHSVQYPSWMTAGGVVVPGKRLDYLKYDYAGRPLSVQDSELPSSQEFIYDLGGTLTWRRDFDGSSVTFTQDADGRLTRILDDSGDYDVVVGLDALGRPQTLDDSAVLDGSLRWTFGYRAQQGGVARVLNLHERRLTAWNLVSVFDYDARDSITSVVHAWQTQPYTVISAEACVYRDDGLLERISGDDANAFRYDGLKQLVWEEAGGLTNEYDPGGNRLYRVDTVAVPNPAPSTYDALNRLRVEAASGAQAAWDADGQLRTLTLPANPTDYRYDAAGRLRQVRNEHFEITYLYDAEGRLFTRTARYLATGQVEQLDVRYVMNRPAAIQRNGQPAALFTWAPSGRLLRLRRHAGGGAGAYPNSFVPVYERLGSIRRWLRADGSEAASVRHDPWGEVVSLNDPLGLTGLIGYRDAYVERLTGLGLLGSRWYSPMLGRWISEEPTQPDRAEAFQESSNRYVYALNNPVQLKDPTGLQAQDEGLWKTDLLLESSNRMLDIATIGSSPAQATLSALQLMVGVFGFASLGDSEAGKKLDFGANVAGAALSLVAIFALGEGIAFVGLSVAAYQMLDYGFDGALSRGELGAAAADWWIEDVDPPGYRATLRQDERQYIYEHITVYACTNGKCGYL